MKKLCAFILAAVTASVVFVSTNAASTETAPKSVTASVTQTFAHSQKTNEKPDRYIGNKNTKKFHLPSCYTLPKEKKRVYFSSRDRAISRNFKPCMNCKP